MDNLTPGARASDVNPLTLPPGTGGQPTDVAAAPVPQPAPEPQTDPAPAPQTDPAAANDALVSSIVDAVTARLVLLTPPAPVADPAEPPPPSVAGAAIDALQIGEAVFTHQPIPAKQSHALALMGLAAGLPILAKVTGQTPAELTPWLNDASIALAFVAAAIGDFTGLGRRKPAA